MFCSNWVVIPLQSLQISFNNFKWGEGAKEVINHAMFRYVM